MKLTREEVIDTVNSAHRGGETPNLCRADLQGADLSQAYLREANLSRAKFNSDTRWPLNFDPIEEEAIRY